MTDSYISLEGKTAVITGAGQGIGLAVAKLFVKYGARVAMIVRKNVVETSLIPHPVVRSRQLRGHFPTMR